MSNITQPGYEYSFFYRYCLIFKKDHRQIVEYFKTLLKENSFEIKEFEEKDQIILLLCQTNEEKLLRQAQYDKLRKKSTNSKEIFPDQRLPQEVIQNESKRNFLLKDRDEFVADNYYDQLYGNKKSDEKWGLGLFTEAEMLYLTYQLLINVELKDADFLAALKGTPLENKTEDLQKYMENERSLFYVLTQFDVIKEHFPLHISDFKEKIFQNTVLSLRCPYRKIRSYFGDKVGIYYGWMYHYTRFLFIPLVISILTMVLKSLFPESTKVLLTLYAILVAIWSQLFIIYWDRKCGEISIEWDNFTDGYDKENSRREFQGEWRRSPITDQYEKYYSDKKRKITYIISFFMSVPYLLFALFVNICFLNLSGFIKPHYNSILEIEFLGKFSEPGQFFEIGSLQNKMIAIIQVIVILMINKSYRVIAEKTCDMENHRVKSNYENSLIIKRFIFEFFDCFISLFYLAFVIHDLNGVKSLIQGLFIANEIRRILTETIIPNIINFFRGSSAIQKLFMKGNKDLMRVGSNITVKDVLEQAESGEYDLFNEYLEIVLEFGYLVLFAECFPLAPLFVVVINNLELRSDIFKLSTIIRRPQCARKRNIGSWHLIFKFLAILSIFTNILITITYSEDTMLKSYVNQGLGASQLLKFFVLEHLVFFVIILIRLLIKSQTYWVTLFLQRRDHNMKTFKWTKLINISKLKAGK